MIFYLKLNTNPWYKWIQNLVPICVDKCIICIMGSLCKIKEFHQKHSCGSDGKQLIFPIIFLNRLNLLGIARKSTLSSSLPSPKNILYAIIFYDI